MDQLSRTLLSLSLFAAASLAPLSASAMERMADAPKMKSEPGMQQPAMDPAMDPAMQHEAMEGDAKKEAMRPMQPASAMERKPMSRKPMKAPQSDDAMKHKK